MGKSPNPTISIYIRNLIFKTGKTMIVQATPLPSVNDLTQTLKSQFSNYSVYTFDSKPQRSLIVRKSATVGAQITVRDNEILVDGCCPNIFISALIGFLSVIFPPYLDFEMEIADFLKSRYQQEIH
jgi:hypothetical protein